MPHVELRPTTLEELAEFLTTAFDEYAEERIQAGQHPDDARRMADRQRAEYFPGDQPGPGHLVYRILDGGEPLGILWIGPLPPQRPESYWVFNIEVDETHRGQGIGRAAMLLAEEEARTHGATVLGLNVFGHNAVARHLYESLGYETTSVQMSKLLTPRH